jgi:hypothetical protein
MSMHSLTILDLGNVLVDLHFDRFIYRCAEVSTRSVLEIRARFFDSEYKQPLERGEIKDEELFAWMVDWLNWPPERKNDLIFFWCDIFSETTLFILTLASFASIFLGRSTWTESLPPTSAASARVNREHSIRSSKKPESRRSKFSFSMTFKPI